MRLRVARHTQKLEAIIHFYEDTLGLSTLGNFEGHNGYNGVFLGLKGADWHLEFTTSGSVPQHQADEDDLLVFYQKSEAEYQNLKDRFKAQGIEPVCAKNPYWNTNGTVYNDPDGYLIVITIAGNY